MSSVTENADQFSRDRIVLELQRNLLVEAGAGSGKTHEMAGRMAAGIASGAYSIENLAAVTFTRKAAAELRGRLQLALETELKQGQRALNAAESNARIYKALSNLERFFSGTIHSFCGRLLRERPVEAGVSPGFTELDEFSDAQFRKQSWRDFLGSSKSAGDPTVLELWDAGIKPKELDDAFEIVCLHEDVDFPTGDALRPDSAPASRALEQFWQVLSGILPRDIDPDTTCRTQKTARNFRRQLRLSSARRARPSTVASLLEPWDFEPKIVQKWWATDNATKKRIAVEVTGLHQTFRTEVVEPFLIAWRHYIYRLSVTVLTTARSRYATARQRANTLNYEDLLQLTARVLRGNANVRGALREKYRWLFVDEFQDTDPVQAEIIFLLAGIDTPGVRDADWRSVSLRPGALFVVGDPKQSIYRFRRADIEIYNLVRAKLSEPRCGEILSLTTNFRSVAALCKWANEVFQSQFPAQPTAHSPQFEPLVSSREEHKSNESGIFTLTIPGSVEQPDVPSSEASLIARYIRSEVAAGRRTFGDFLILLRKRRNIGVYAEALESLHIPVGVSGAGAFGESSEVGQLALLLRALSDPQDSASLVGLLRGPLFGISDQNLFAFRQAGGWFSIFNSVESSPVSSALASLRQMYRWTRLLPAGAAVERILEHTGYLALAATTPGGVEAGDILHATDRVRQVIESGQSLAAAASALEADREASGEVESLPLEPGRSDVVRVMNLHKAKGLESPVVFLADPCGGFKPRVDVRIVREGLSASGYFCIKRRVSDFKEVLIAAPAGWQQHEIEEQAYLAAEEHRLLYVAATRARDQLIVGRWASASIRGTRAWEAFDPFLNKAVDLLVPSTAEVPAAQEVDLSTGANMQAYIARLAAHKRVLAPSWSTTSVTAEARRLPKITRLVENDAEDPNCALLGGTASHGADAGLAWGALLHGLLEHAMRHQGASLADLTRFAMWLTFDEPELRPVVDEAVRTVEELTRSEFWESAKRSDHAVEVPFQFAESPTSMLAGVIDLVFKSSESWEVVDYKTDINLSEDGASRLYAYQLDAYKRALASCGVPNSMASIKRVRFGKKSEAMGS